jgi:hypothetical protein
MAALLGCFCLFSNCGSDDEGGGSPDPAQAQVDDLRGAFFFENASDLQLEITTINESQATLEIPDFLVSGRIAATFTANVSVNGNVVNVEIPNGTTVGNTTISGLITYDSNTGSVTYNITFDGTNYSGNAYNLRSGAGLGLSGNCDQNTVTALQQQILAAANNLFLEIQQGGSQADLTASVRDYLSQVRGFYVVIQENCGIDLSEAISAIDQIINSLG